MGQTLKSRRWRKVTPGFAKRILTRRRGPAPPLYTHRSEPFAGSAGVRECFPSSARIKFFSLVLLSTFGERKKILAGAAAGNTTRTTRTTRKFNLPYPLQISITCDIHRITPTSFSASLTRISPESSLGSRVSRMVESVVDCC